MDTSSKATTKDLKEKEDVVEEAGGVTSSCQWGCYWENRDRRPLMRWVGKGGVAAGGRGAGGDQDEEAEPAPGKAAAEDHEKMTMWTPRGRRLARMAGRQRRRSRTK